MYAFDVCMYCIAHTVYFTVWFSYRKLEILYFKCTRKLHVENKIECVCVCVGVWV